MASNRSQFEELLERYEPEVRDAFLAAFDAIKAAVTTRLLRELAAALDRGDITGAINLLGLEPAAFSALDMAIASTFNGGGIAMVQEIPIPSPMGGRVTVNFGVRNVVAEARLRDLSSTLVTRVTEEQVDMLRRNMTEGLARGQNPTQTALDVVGRVNRVTGRREGGYLGLSGPQERTSAKATNALLSGDAQGMREYLQLKHRDKRFDRAVLKAIAEGRALSREDVTRIIGRMNDRQLKYRADVIGLNETFEALSAAKDEGMRQAIEAGKVDARFVTKVWRHSFGDHPRLQHKAMNGKSVGYNAPFIMADGTAMMYPHDPKAPARHKLGCRCSYEIRIDYAAMLAAQRRVLQ